MLFQGVYLKSHCLIVFYFILANFYVDCIQYSSQKVIKYSIWLGKDYISLN